MVIAHLGGADPKVCNNVEGWGCIGGVGVVGWLVGHTNINGSYDA